MLLLLQYLKKLDECDPTSAIGDKDFQGFRDSLRFSGGSAAGVYSMATPEVATATSPVPASTEDIPSKATWVSVVKNKPNLSKHDFKVDVFGDTPLWEDFLVGRFL